MRSSFLVLLKTQLLFSVVHFSLGTEDLDFVEADAVLPVLRLGHQICALKVDEGPCKAIIPRYYFNIYTQQCEMFTYGGCEGNENNFISIEACQEKCEVKDATAKRTRLHGGPVISKYCQLDADPGPCRGFFTRYFYNNVSHNCETFEYGGCLGNENNFRELENCQNTCQGKSQDGPSFCKSAADIGMCKAKEKRFYYDHTLGRCKPFLYSGCGGNNNNFTSRRSCLQVCKKGSNRNSPSKLRRRRVRMKKIKVQKERRFEPVPIEMT
ncbi:tissue factor pathway inhibitor isoform X2 [Latimeria chalumnae]|uniref:tissue factor pathway inhibitor isoform X2 n=1 Tax=Latimeria chalumnae TaxID=7897 RepID=UPI0006D907DD|nr:PREDICTED: tissue factor pathway inhibitor isoform X3 [Latimeria chalumnae]|eukprot:XP_014353101.1 PREDICTED: tissue factor pathway inhibitor isoform X3 [Latimeria chalumnae]